VLGCTQPNLRQYFLIAARAYWVSVRGRFGLKNRSTKVGVLFIALAAGVNMNDLGIVDVSRGAQANVWVETISGAAVRQGLPVRVEAA
jgi:hypothetical protein